MTNRICHRFRRCVLMVMIGMLMAQLSLAQQTLLLDKVTITEGNTAEMPERIVENIEDGVITTYVFHSLLKQRNPLDNSTFYLKIPGFGLNTEEFTPAFPMRRDSYVVPENMTCSVFVVDSSYVEIPMALAPATPPQIISNSIQDKNEVCQIKAYEGFYPQQITSSSMEKYGNSPIMNVQLCPVQYNYNNKTVRIYKKITYKIHFIGYDKKVVSKNLGGKYDAFINNTCINAVRDNLIKSTSTDSSIETRNDYLIISTSKYKDAVFAFAKWKGMLGFNTHIELRDSGQWTSTLIKNTIDGYRTDYEDLSYVLLIGDHEDVPAKTTSTPGVVSDFYYVNTLYDISSIGLGRLSVSTPEEASVVVGKIIAYEKSPVPDQDFYSNVLDCAYFQDRSNPIESEPHTGYAQRRFAQTAEDIRNHLLLQGKEVERVYYCHSNSDPKYWNNGLYSNGEEIPVELQKPNFMWNGHAIDILMAINSGTFCVVHNDHGGPDQWRDPALDKKYISHLENGNKTPVVFSINCESGKFNDPACFAETFLRWNQGGCVAIYAFSGDGYSGYNDALILGMIDAIWPTPPLIPTFPGKISHATTTPTPVYTLSQILKQGLKRMDETWYESTNNTRKLIYERFHCFGDPSMKIYTEAPTAFSDALVTRDDGHIYVYTGGINATISFYDTETGNVVSYMGSNAVFSGNIETISVCISSHNKIPYIDECPLTYIQNLEIGESACYENVEIRVGSNVTSTELEGPVIFESGTTTLRAKSVLLKGVTEVQQGAGLEIIPQQ